MKKSTLCFCIQNGKILLAMKKRGFGTGKLNGYGGKIKKGENPKTAAIRELKEESGLCAKEKDLQEVALLFFYFEGKPIFECSVFLIYDWTGIPIETEEMKPCWYSILRLPFEKMWAADKEWMPLVFSGNQIQGKIDFNKDGSIVNGFSYKVVRFK